MINENVDLSAFVDSETKYLVYICKKGGKCCVKISVGNCVHASSGAYPASYPMGIRGSFPGVKVARA
jgi:hypothetical protein